MTDAEVSHGFRDITIDQHGDFQYTLRQYLLMRRLQLGGEWTDVVKDVNRGISEHDEWDIDTRATYRDFTTWYTLGAAGSGPAVDREPVEHSDSD